ncbi:unnamed protein product [Cylicocyclus nassatus]|uniref:Uncharacterized protein n=1 Tax=Cylicocyclus nassatus TaxID=53992 RepID=A0AA36M4T7_CYLNA|nr:unnamed protein product [Cylicocyclus nassatus]
MANNLILLSAMKTYTGIDQETLKKCFTEFTKTRKYICTMHFVNAAQYILDDVLKAGGTLSQVKNGNFILNGVPVFVSKKLNSATTSFADEVLISSNDVITFENYYMERYCDNGCWNIPEAHPKIKKEKQTHIKEEKTHIEAIMLMEDKAGTSDASNDANETTNDFFIPEEQAESTADSENPLELSETDPSLLNKVFSVQGKDLLELFHLSRCGCEDNSAGRVRLIEKDSAPVILYVSTGKEPEVKRWKGQVGS